MHVTSIYTVFLAGKMIDYVKCLNCGTEKIREDTFLDIPLPVRPFGCNVAYGSVVSIINSLNSRDSEPSISGKRIYLADKTIISTYIRVEILRILFEEFADFCR